MKLACPAALCGNEDPKRFQLVENVGRYWDVVSEEEDLPKVVLRDNDELDASGGLYRLYCKECGMVSEVPEEIEIEYE